MSQIISKFRLFYDILRFGKQENSQSGYGTLYGVYLPGVLTMFGVIIFLRLGWITGSLGLAGTTLLISFSCIIVFLTALSIASAATNMKVEGGGTYYMVSRSLGIELGSAVGIPLYLAQAITISFCAMGFAETVQPMLPTVPLSYIGTAALSVMALLSFSTSFALNTQFFIFMILITSIVSLFSGGSVDPETITDSLLVEGGSLSFWTAFAIFFPAATGIEAGVAMSGDLHSPRKSLPLGTIAVLLTGFIVYIAIASFLSFHAPDTLLANDPWIVHHIAKFPALITAGVWAATLSSILGGLMAAPRTLRALAKDGVLPSFLTKEFGKGKEPLLASALTFGIALMGIWYGSVNQIAPVLTMFLLISYAILNLATGLEELMSNPSWRPTFRAPWIVSISGFGLCLVAMFMIDPGSTFIAMLFTTSIYLYVRKRGISNRWEDIRQGFLLFLSRFAIYRLSNSENSLRSWRPNFLVFAANPMKLSNMVSITSAMTKDKGFLTLSSVFSPTIADQEKADRWKKMVTQFLHEKKIEALVEFSVEQNLFGGAQKLITTYGIGSITPNTIVLGGIQSKEMLEDCLKVMKLTHESQKNLVILSQEQELKPTTKNIDVWWDDDSRKNSELMLLLAHMLLKSRDWKGGSIRVKSLVPDEKGRAQRLTYFQDFLFRSRIYAEPQIYVAEKSLESLYYLASNFSTDADIVFLGLRPIGNDESLEDFEKYFTSVQSLTKNLPHIAFVTNSDQIDLTGIFR